MRLSKNSIQYTYDGDRLLKEDRNGTPIYYYYGVDGIAAFEYNGEYYYYVKNLLGDVTELLCRGDVVARYHYDAFGNHKVYDGSGDERTEASFVGNVNPIRYRSYYYDVETGFYYLQTRYYDPDIGRFISPDSLNYLEPETINGLNLYAYCLNNPVMYSDPGGNLPGWVTGIGRIVTGVGAVVVGVLVLTSGVALAPMIIVAGMTIAAGALTIVNGAADIQQSLTGDNFIRDSIFGGNQTAYNWYAGITEGVAVLGSMVCGTWYKINQPRIRAYNSMKTYSVKGRHLPYTSGNNSRNVFNTMNQAELRAIGKEAIKRTPMKSLLRNSADSYALLYDVGRVISTRGLTSIKLVFSEAGKIITFFPL